MRKSIKKRIYYQGEYHIVDSQVIKMFRIFIDKSQTDIAKELGLSRESVTNWENGYSETPHCVTTWFVEHGLIQFNDSIVNMLEEWRRLYG